MAIPAPPPPAPTVLEINVQVSGTASSATYSCSLLSSKPASSASVASDCALNLTGVHTPADLKYTISNDAGLNYVFERPKAEAFYTSDAQTKPTKPWKLDRQFTGVDLSSDRLHLEVRYSNCNNVGGISHPSHYYNFNLISLKLHSPKVSVDPEIKNGSNTQIYGARSNC